MCETAKTINAKTTVMKSLRALSLALALLISGLTYANNGPCNKNETPGKKVNEINGSVIQNGNKKPLSEVSITAYYTSKKEKVVITDCNGNYAFDDLKPGTYKFVFEKEGYKKVTRENVNIRTDEPFLLNVEMVLSEETKLFPSIFHFMDNEK